MEPEYLRQSLKPPASDSLWFVNNTKDYTSTYLSILETRREAYEDELLKVLDGNFSLIAPPNIVDALETRNMPNVQRTDSSPYYEEESEDEQSLTFGDDLGSDSALNISDSMSVRNIPLFVIFEYLFTNETFIFLFEKFESEGVDDWLLH